MIGLATIALLLAFSTHRDSYYAGYSDDIKMFRWVGRTGKLTVLRANVAKALGLGKEDIGVIERGFRERGEKFTHVLAIPTAEGARDVAIFARINEADGSGITWYRSLSAGLTLTAILDGNGNASLLPNSRYEREFNEERNYFKSKFLETTSAPTSPQTAYKSRLMNANEHATASRVSKRVLGADALLVYAPWSWLGIIIIFWLGARPPPGNPYKDQH